MPRDCRLWFLRWDLGLDIRGRCCNSGVLGAETQNIRFNERDSVFLLLIQPASWQHANEKTPVLTRCDLAHMSELHWTARRETEKQAHSRCQWKMNTFIFTFKIVWNGRKPPEIQLQNSEYYCRPNQTCHKQIVCKSKQKKKKEKKRREKRTNQQNSNESNRSNVNISNEQVPTYILEEIFMLRRTQNYAKTMKETGKSKCSCVLVYEPGFDFDCWLKTLLSISICRSVMSSPVCIFIEPL